jgi:hypothetical protein
MAEQPGKTISIVAADLRLELEKGTSKAELMKMWKCKKVDIERAIQRYGITATAPEKVAKAAKVPMVA